jgi:hypothetical protein
MVTSTEFPKIFVPHVKLGFSHFLIIPIEMLHEFRKKNNIAGRNKLSVYALFSKRKMANYLPSNSFFF